LYYHSNIFGKSKYRSNFTLFGRRWLNFDGHVLLSAAVEFRLAAVEFWLASVEFWRPRFIVGGGRILAGGGRISAGGG
jgi:hypothetical protein